MSAAPNPAPTFNGTVYAVAYAGETAYVGGDFTIATVNGRSYTRNRLAAFDVRTGALRGWAPSADARVRAIAVSGGSVYIGGAFGYVSGARRDSLARLSASTGAVHSFKHSLSGQPYSLAVANGRLYAGGNISLVDGQPRSRLAAFSLSTGALDGTWRPSVDSTVEAVAATADRVYVGGKFGAVNGTSQARLAAVHPASGELDSGFRARPADIAHGLTVSGGAVYAAHGGPGGRVVAYGLDGASRWNLTMDGDPHAVTVLDGIVYFGGHFDNVCRSARTGYQGECLDGKTRRVKLGAADTSSGTLLSWSANGNGVEGVFTMAVHTSLRKVAAGGAFTAINGAQRERFVQFG
ncbi:hypothetical protein [Micromonospora sp. CPCC 206061]|uniref:hypothetical protein n=1 Tax=Micromonospora sp. CPCC 206061 TaxID=3122410 RepID=UPI002FF4298A